MRVISIQNPLTVKCQVCTEVKPCGFLDWDLNGHVCGPCAIHCRSAEVQIGAWMFPPFEFSDLPPIEELGSPVRPDGLPYNARRANG